MKPKRFSLCDPGHFVLGANYWASHAGTRMWADWRPAVVANDLRRLRKGGLQVLRVFPLWPDFQPVTLLRSGGGQPAEYRFGEEPLSDDPCGQAGMSAVAMAHFGEFLDLAATNKLRLIVGLLTGWMSGRLFVPPALEGLNMLTDSAAIGWELRFVRHFVTTFKTHPAILAWDLGNECNCMGSATQDQARAWTATIVNGIRAVDPARPVVSGLHGLSPEGNWTMQDQGEWTDLLTTHPYPVFTPHCDQDPVNTIRTALHSTAESRFYADLGGKPCLCEEIGTLGPTLASEKIAADFIRTALLSLWANDCHGLLWWCAHDQGRLTHAPYDWCALERELGLLRANGVAKPVLKTIGEFGAFLAGLPFPALPLRTREAVCILTQDQDGWGVAYSSFVLAKQAGFDVEFQYATQPIRDAALYLLPNLCGHRMIPRRRLWELLARVRAGATLYLSLDSGILDGFEPLTGMEPQTRARRRASGRIRLEGLDGAPEIPCGGDFRLEYRPTRAQVLGREADGNPVCSVAAYGRGKVYFLGVPMEMMLTRTPGAFHGEEALLCWQLYRHIAATAIRRSRVTGKRHPMVAVTEHPMDRRHRVIVAINQSPTAIVEALSLQAGWTLARLFRGKVRTGDAGLQCTLPANDGVVLVVKR